jgi:pimeloyl-ACP methyl ester carboxylesterase
MTSVRVRQFDVEVNERGGGPPLLFLHWELGPRWSALHDRLAEQWRVIAPSHPGFGNSSGGDQIHDVHDLIYFYLDVLDELGLRGLPLVGHGLGGMFAAELAAVQPERFSHLVLLAPFGLWLPDAPTLDLFAAAPAELSAALYADQSSPAAVAASHTPTDQAGQIEQALERAKSQASAARYLWPIPNRGLSKRLHRVRAPTLLVWGEQDGVTPPAYGEAFRGQISGARLEVMPHAAHQLLDEQPEELAAITLDFLGATQTRSGGLTGVAGSTPRSTISTGSPPM